jgi:hypothetical protein
VLDALRQAPSAKALRNAKPEPPAEGRATVYLLRPWRSAVSWSFAVGVVAVSQGVARDDPLTSIENEISISSTSSPFGKLRLHSGLLAERVKAKAGRWRWLWSDGPGVRTWLSV